MIESALRTYLLARSAISALVGDRVYLERVVQGDTFPRITLGTTDAEPQYYQSGVHDLVDRRVSIEAWGLTDTSAKTLADKVRDALSGFSGLMGEHWVPSCEIESIQDSYVPPADASDDGVYVVTISFRIWHDEPLPTYV